MLDPEALAEIIAETVRHQVERGLAPIVEENGRLRERIAVLEAREIPAPDTSLVKVIVDEAVAALPPAEPGKDGKDFVPDMGEVARLLDESVARHIARIERPKDGTSVTIEDVQPLIDEAVSRSVAALPPAQPGKDGEDFAPDASEIGRVLDESVARHMATIERPKDGTSVTLADVQPLIDDAVSKAVAGLPVPKDGVGLASALIDRSGALVVTLTDGSTRPLGPVVGRDYDADVLARAVTDAVAQIPAPKDGDPGKDADPIVIRQMVEEAVAAIPAPRDGKDAYPGEARGLFDPEAEYRALDVVSFNGSEWRAKTDAPGPLPGDGWMLSAQRGKPGKPGEPGKAGPAAPEIIAGYADEKALSLVLTKDNGAEITVDLYDLASKIRDA